jgi:hypothetical protein
MLQLVITVCLLQGSACRELAPVTIPNTSMSACFMASQVEAGKWIAENPDYQVRKIVCRPPGRVARM